MPASLSATADAAVSLGKKGSKADAAAVPAKPTLKTWVHSLFQVRGDRPVTVPLAQYPYPDLTLL